MSSPMSGSTSVYLADGLAVVTPSGVLRLGLVLAGLHDGVDLLVGDVGALQAQRLARAHRQERSPSPVPDERNRARLVEDDARSVSDGWRMPAATKHVCLDQAGDDVNRGPLRERRWMPRRPRLLHDADNGILDVAGRSSSGPPVRVDDGDVIRMGLDHAPTRGS